MPRGRIHGSERALPLPRGESRTRIRDCRPVRFCRRCSLAVSTRGAHRVRDKIVNDADGKPLFRIRFSRPTAAILLPESVMSRSLETITKALIGALDTSSEITQPGTTTTGTDRARAVRRSQHLQPRLGTRVADQSALAHE